MNSETKVLIAHAFFIKNDHKQLKEKFKPYPPLATLYAAGLLRNRGYNVSLFDAVLSDGIEQFISSLKTHCPDYLIIYEDDFNFLTKMCLSHVRESTLSMVRSATKYVKATVVHSSDATDNPKAYLENGADYVITGEGDQTLLELLDALSNEKDRRYDYPCGIIYTDAYGSTVYTERRTTMRNLDSLPQPAWDLVDFDRYRTAWKQRHGFFSLNMVTTRGCPYKCNWCAKPIWGQQYVSHTPEFIANQLETLVTIASPDHIWFADDIFGLKKGWIERFAELINEKNICTDYMIQSRADLIDKETAEQLKKSGCIEVWLGVESGNQEVLNAMDKGILVEQVYESRRLLKCVGIKVGFFLQLGYPGEDIQELSMTRNMMLEALPDEIGVSVAYPLPGTEFYNRVKHQIKDKSNWEESNDLDAVFTSTFSADFYRAVRNHLHEELNHINQGKSSINWNRKWKTLMDEGERYKHMEPIRLKGMGA